MMENYSANIIKQKLQSLLIWKSNISVEVLEGGWTNDTYLVTDGNEKYVAKVGGDKRDFGVIRSNELLAHRAAHQAGISPNIIYHKKEISIYEYIHSKILTPQEIREEKNLKKIIYLINIVHKKVTNYLKYKNLFLNIFQIIEHRFYVLKKYKSLYTDTLNDIIDDCKLFQKKTKSQKIVFSHNDYYFKNFLFDDKKFWLIDWEFSGFNPNILDLANLSRNIELNEEEENFILEEYFGSAITSKLINVFKALKCISNLNAVMWWMLAEIKSKKSFDYKFLTEETIEKYKISKQNFFKQLD